MDFASSLLGGGGDTASASSSNAISPVYGADNTADLWIVGAALAAVVMIAVVLSPGKTN